MSNYFYVNDVLGMEEEREDFKKQNEDSSSLKKQLESA